MAMATAVAVAAAVCGELTIFWHCRKQINNCNWRASARPADYLIYVRGATTTIRKDTWKPALTRVNHHRHSHHRRVRFDCMLHSCPSETDKVRQFWGILLAVCWQIPFTCTIILKHTHTHTWSALTHRLQPKSKEKILLKIQSKYMHHDAAERVCKCDRIEL